MTKKEPSLSEKTFYTSFWDSSCKSTDRFTSEDDILSYIHSLFPLQNEHVLLGRGDDCTLLQFTQSSCVLSSDSFIQDVHFSMLYMTPFEVGQKSLSQAVSDIAAMGASPLAFSLALSLPTSLQKQSIQELLKGMHSIADKHNIILSGGDLSTAKELSIHISIWGSLAKGCTQYLYRKQAQEGDILFALGELGLARAGFYALEKIGREKAKDLYPLCCKAFLQPEARISQGIQINRFATQHACTIGLMDLSDGLIQDIPRLLSTQQGVELCLQAKDAPSELLCFANDFSLNSLEWILKGGEEYALLGTVPASLWTDFTEEFPSCIKVGTIINKQGLYLGTEKILYHGFDHFLSE